MISLKHLSLENYKNREEHKLISFSILNHKIYLTIKLAIMVIYYMDIFKKFNSHFIKFHYTSYHFNFQNI